MEKKLEVLIPGIIMKRGYSYSLSFVDFNPRLKLLLLFLAIAFSQLAYGELGTSIGTGLTIVDTTAPVINLTSPLNNSGNINENVTFFYNVSDASDVNSCSLLINGKTNITDTSITKNARTNFRLNSTNLGPYNWSINCTDSLGLIGSSDARSFSVFFLKQSNFTITNLSLVDIGDVTNFFIEESNSGKINFRESLDLSQGMDLGKHINISFNRIELNSTALSALNKSATLHLYGLAFTNPRVLADGAICPDSICTEVSYSGGTFAFNVTHFTAYSSEETPGGGDGSGSGSSSSGGSGSSSSGGGGVIPQEKTSDFTIDKSTIKITLKQGQTKEEFITVKNTGGTDLDLAASLQALKEFIISPSLDEIKTRLSPDNEKTLSFIFGAKKDQIPDIYVGEIKITSGNIEKIVNTIMEIESARPLFDVDVLVLPEYKSIFPGKGVYLDVSLFNVRGFGRVDVSLEYSIKDFKGNLIAKEEETLAVENQAKFGREILLPSDIKPGTYVASVKVNYEDSVGISSDIFEVKAKSIRLYPIAINDYTFYLLLGIVAVFVVSIFIMYEFSLNKKKHAPKTKEEEGKVAKKEDKAKKMEKELEALEQGHKAKFISDESFERRKEEIEKELKRLKE